VHSPIVVDVCDCAAGEDALRWAADWATDQRRELVVVYVRRRLVTCIGHDISAVVAEWQEALEHEVRENVRRLLGWHREALGEWRLVTRQGSVAKQLMTVAREEQAVAVLVGSCPCRPGRRALTAASRSAAIPVIEIASGDSNRAGRLSGLHDVVRRTRRTDASPLTDLDRQLVAAMSPDERGETAALLRRLRGLRDDR